MAKYPYYPIILQQKQHGNKNFPRVNWRQVSFQLFLFFTFIVNFWGYSVAVLLSVAFVVECLKFGDKRGPKRKAALQTGVSLGIASRGFKRFHSLNRSLCRRTRKEKRERAKKGPKRLFLYRISGPSLLFIPCRSASLPPLRLRIGSRSNTLQPDCGRLRPEGQKYSATSGRQRDGEQTRVQTKCRQSADRRAVVLTLRLV